MHKFLLTILLSVTIAISAPLYTALSDYSPSKDIDLSNLTVPELIDYFAVQYNQDPNLLKKIASCESGFTKDKVGDKGLAFSVFQFHKPTFDRWSKEMGQELDYGNYIDHVRLAAWAFSRGETYRDDWTTYVAYKHGGSYSFYSSLLHRSYTVYCR